LRSWKPISTWPFLRTWRTDNARPVAVAPGRALNRPQHVIGLDLANVPQVVLQHPLLDGHLRTDVQVLHLAAAARTLVQAKVRAIRAHALGRLAVDFGQRALLKTVFLAVDLALTCSKGKRPVNEHHLAIRPVGHTLGFQVKRLHQEPIRRIARGRVGRKIGWRKVSFLNFVCHGVIVPDRTGPHGKTATGCHRYSEGLISNPA
jgi:hypothetical protein